MKRRMITKQLLFLMAIAFVLPMMVSAQEDSYYQARAGQASAIPQKHDMEPQDNFCRGGSIRDNLAPEFKAIMSSELSAVIDENPATFTVRKRDQDSWLEIKFQGAWQWVNFIEVRFRESENFELATFSNNGIQQNVTPLSSSISELDGGIFSMAVEFEPTKANGLRWSWSEAALSGEEIEIYEIRAWFYFPDPDKLAKGPLDDANNWLLCENIAGMGTADMRPLWNQISTLAGWCPNVNHFCHWWNGGAAWAIDFKRAAIGGGEDNHSFPAPPLYTGMDYHDLAVVALHGNPCNIFFPTGPAPVTAVLSPTFPPNDILAQWGERDAEWFVALSCSPYAWPNCPWRWASGFNGLHLQCGFTTTAFATNGAFLGGFARLMIGSPPWFPPMTITNSWFLARRLFQPAGTCVIVVADNLNNFGDFLWTRGPVSPDPAPPGGVVFARWDPPFTADESRTKEFPPALTTNEEKAIGEMISSSSARVFPAKGSKGIPIRTTDRLLSKQFPSAMTIYHLEPHAIIDSGYMESLASSICIRNPHICNPDLWKDAADLGDISGSWWGVTTNATLMANPEHAFIQFVSTGRFLGDLTSPPSLPAPLAAVSQAVTDLNNFDLSATDACSYETSYNVQTAYNLDAQMIVPESTFNLSINVDFNRCVGGYKVYGPGGSMGVTYGQSFELQHLTRGSWHNLGSASTEAIITITTAIDLLNKMGEDATIGGIPPEFDTLLILPDSSEVAYYETNGEYVTDYLEPIYKLKCYGINAYDTFPCNVYVPAKASLLRGIIDSPKNGSTFQKEANVTFSASSMGGVTPHTYKWYSDVDGYLGSGASLVKNNLSVAKKDTVTIPHTITLEVTDGNQAVDSTQISVTILPCCDRPGDANNNGIVNIQDITYLISFLYKGGPKPPCTDEGDANGSGIINIQDITHLINFLYKGGPAPICP